MKKRPGWLLYVPSCGHMWLRVRFSVCTKCFGTGGRKKLKKTKVTYLVGQTLVNLYHMY